jgi:hypothetical protein
MKRNSTPSPRITLRIGKGPRLPRSTRVRRVVTDRLMVPAAVVTLALGVGLVLAGVAGVPPEYARSWLLPLFAVAALAASRAAHRRPARPARAGNGSRVSHSGGVASAAGSPQAVLPVPA